MTTTIKKYTIEVHKEEEGGYSGRCPQVPGANSQGETLKELEENMKEAIALVLEDISAEQIERQRNRIKNAGSNNKI